MSITAGKPACFLENKLLSSKKTISCQQRLFKSRGDESVDSKTIVTKHRTEDYELCDYFWRERGKWRVRKYIGSTERKIKPYQTKPVLVFFVHDEFQCSLRCVKEKWWTLQTLNIKNPPRVHLQHEQHIQLQVRHFIHLTSSSVI